jgi:hypothetical protein
VGNARAVLSARSEPQFVLCLRNDDYTASLELRKVYLRIDDPVAAEHQLIRVVDESGEDYLYPADYFIPIELPEAVAKAFALVA